MKRLISLPIRWLLLLIVFVVALPAAATIIFTAVYLRNETLRDAGVDTQTLVDRIVAEQQSLVTGAEQLLAALAQIPDVRRHEKQKVEAILKRLVNLNQMYGNILVADINGVVWASALPVTPPYISDRRHFLHALTTGRFSSGEYVISRSTRKPTLNFAYPFRNADDEITGVINVEFNIEKYRELPTLLHFPPGTSFVLIDHRGTILSRGLDPRPFVGKQYPAAVFRSMLKGPETGTSIRTGLTGDKRIISYRKIRLSGEDAPYMFITAGVPVAIALKRAQTLLLFNITLFVSFLLGALLMAWIIGKRSIVDRIAQLEDASMRVAAGDLGTRVSEVVTGGELGRLGEAFDVMSRQLALRERTMRENERFLAAIIDTAPECVKLLSQNGAITLINRAGLDMLQEKFLDRVEGQNIFRYIDPQHHEAFKRAIEDVFKGKDRTLEFRIVGAQGRPLWLETHAGPLRNENGEIISLLGITENITERKELDRLKDEMISAVSHEMRTPLTAMLGYVELMIEHEVDEAHEKEYLKVVHKESERLNELIGTFLDMQRISVTGPATERIQLQLKPLLEETCKISADAFRNHIFDLNISPDLPAVMGSEEEIRTVLRNLLSNAVKFSPQGSRIELGARPDRDDVVIWVKDEGIGIPPEEQERIFDQFYRVNNRPSRTTGGTGLGLALVKKIVVAHGGKTWVESSAGNGSTFYLSLPKSEP